MSPKINFRVIARSYSRPISCPADSEAGIRKFILETLLQLQPDQWLLAEPMGNFSWSLLSALSDLPSTTDGFESAAHDLADALGDTTLAAAGFPNFDFEYSRLAFRDTSFSNSSSIGIVGRVDKTPLLICENDYESSHGVVSLKQIAAYEYFQDSTGAPVSWSGGARLIQVNTEKAISFSTGDSASRPEFWEWSIADELDDNHAKALVSWLDEYNLVPALAWSVTKIGNAHSATDRAVLEEILQGETSGLSLSLSLTQKELGLVIEYCPKASDLFLPIRSMLTSNKDALLRDLFTYFGLSGLLADGGRRLEETYSSYNAARKVIQRYFLPTQSTEEDLPSLARTRAVISRLENIELLDSLAEKIRILTASDDDGLRLARVWISREKSESAQHELIANLLSAFRTWESWRDLEEFLPSLKQSFQEQD
jgi:hypothetical protein